MNRLASVRFDRVLADAERAEAARILASADAKVTSWDDRPDAGRTYASLVLGANAEPQALAALVSARVDEPSLVVLEVRAADRGELEALAGTLGGPGRLAGVVDCRLAGESLLLELNDALTPLSLAVDLIDVVLRRNSGRRILPLLGLSDRGLAAFAGALLAEPALDASRLIETWLDPANRVGAAP